LDLLSKKDTGEGLKGTSPEIHIKEEKPYP